ncbi:MAG: Dihydropteroate synthase [Bacteroidetes bacterium]|nr:Dihydropteroate synthase [Bacteroidota bacterium]
MSFKNNEIKPIDYSCNGKTLTFSKPMVMAIINITPDSFYDGGKYGHVNDVLADVAQKIKNGADIIDIGAASSRPGAVEINEHEEWDRLQPALVAIRKEFPDVFISVDTYRSSVAEKSADSGMDIINDISGGNFDENMFQTVSYLQLPYILMHIQGVPQNMQVNPHYTHVAKEVRNDFEAKISQLKNLDFNKIIIDPGFGFGKNVEHNFTLLKELETFINLGFPLLAGFSRKSMINKIIKTNPVTSLNGTTVLNTIALMNGAKILRVHDVTEAKQAIELVEFYKNN